MTYMSACIDIAKVIKIEALDQENAKRFLDDALALKQI